MRSWRHVKWPEVTEDVRLPLKNTPSTTPVPGVFPLGHGNMQHEGNFYVFLQKALQIFLLQTSHSWNIRAPLRNRTGRHCHAFDPDIWLQLTHTHTHTCAQQQRVLLASSHRSWCFNLQQKTPHFHPLSNETFRPAEKPITLSDDCADGREGGHVTTASFIASPGTRAGAATRDGVRQEA